MTKSTIGIALATVALLFAQDRIKPGLWENTVTSHGRSITRKNCLTEAELATTNGTVQAIREAMTKKFAGTNGCTLKDLKIEGNSMTSQTVCGASSSTTVMVFHGDSAETTSTSTRSGVITVTHITGRRVGVCP